MISILLGQELTKQMCPPFKSNEELSKRVSGPNTKMVSKSVLVHMMLIKRTLVKEDIALLENPKIMKETKNLDLVSMTMANTWIKETGAMEFLCPSLINAKSGLPQMWDQVGT